MAERNLIKEGFLFNTLAPDGSVSGTQTVSIPEMNALVDENLTSTALTVTGTFFTSLDADMGARWKLDRVDLYTDESSSSNFEMSVSEDGSNFFPLTMTGSTGLWSASVSGTTVSGAPRYLRYEHTAITDRIVREWRAINDETLVDFGTTGSQTSVTVEDAPIGKPSDQVTALPIFNRFDKTAQGFVFIENTGGKGDDNIEIGLTPSGPFFGRQTQTSFQPNNLPWYEFSSLSVSFGTRPNSQGEGVFSTVSQAETIQNVRVVSGTGYFENFTDATVNGWTTPGFTSLSVIAGSLTGLISTTNTPAFALDNTFGNSLTVSPDSVPDITNGFIPFRAEDYDTVQITLTTPKVLDSDFVESVRLFWRDHTGAAYSTSQSVLSETPLSNFTGSPQDFTFDVGSETTWSGTIRSLKVQNYTTATGIGLSSTLNSVEVYKGDRRDRVALDFAPVISGSFVDLLVGATTTLGEFNTVINVENVITEPCIITQVSVNARPGFASDTCGWVLIRPANGFVYNDDAVAVNAFSNPWEVVEFVMSSDVHDISSTNIAQTLRQPVFWSAQQGDFLAFTYRVLAGAGNGSLFTRSTSLTNTTNGALFSPSFTTIESTETKSGLTTSFNGLSDWQFDSPAINVSVQFKSISAGRYVSSGVYTTPIFDGGGDPALLSFDFDSETNNNTTIDVSGASAFDTVNARASSAPPNSASRLGIRKNQYFLGAHPSDVPSRFNPNYLSNYVIGLFNAQVETRESSTGPEGDTEIENIGTQVLYHENKKETWVLNVLISGTVGTDMRPTWDVYDLDTGSYLRTDHVGGSITYFHSNNGSGNETNSFEPSGWVADYIKEEIYIITRENEFSVSNGTYNGIILDLDGKFKDVFWRNDQLTQDMVDASLPGANITSNADKRLTAMRNVAYRDGYFFALTNEDGAGNSYGTLINVYRHGNNPNDPENENDVEFITEIDINSVPGFSFVSESIPIENITYCSVNDLFYLTHVGSGAVLGVVDIYTMKIEKIGSSPTETFVASQGPISNVGGTQVNISRDLFDGFGFGPANTINNWGGAGSDQDLKLHASLAYSSDRDSLVHLELLASKFSPDFSRTGEFVSNNNLFHRHTHTAIVELSADTVGVEVNTPTYPHRQDPVWGTLSGTLGYEAVQEDSVLFPTGRYAQLKYQLNANSNRLYSPYLVESHVNQGLRVSNIPSLSTKTIYLRTNIPETETIGDQTGRLKVFWELQSD